MNHFTHALVISVFGFTLSACGGGSGAESRTARDAQASKAKTPTPGPEGGVATIDPEIARACGLSAPRFAFDSERISGPAAQTLDEVARCFVQGPLTGRSMNVVGHADPRGETEYNLGLGHRRAGSVLAYLQDRGVAQSQVNASSRGDLEATGADESGWSNDRRVDISLVR